MNLSGIPCGVPDLFSLCFQNGLGYPKSACNFFEMWYNSLIGKGFVCRIKREKGLYIDMKKSRLLVFVLSLILILGLLPVGVVAEDATFDSYYCRSALATMPNSVALLYAYDQIVAGVEASLGEIKVYNDTDPITADEVRMVIDAYRRDHTEHFWFGNQYTMSYNSTSVLRVVPTYIMEGEALVQARLLFDAALESMVAGITDAMSEFECELILHDRLAGAVTYVDSDNAHNAYGALVEGKAVCEGYAEALQCLLHRVGIQSLIVLGSSVNPSTGTPEGHAWNMVRIDGKYYHTDLTWNDQGRMVYHAYFNQTDLVIREDHEITPTNFALPVCNAQTANYFVVKGGLLTEYNLDMIAELLKNNDLSVSLYLNVDVDTFIAWYREHISEIVKKVGVSGSYSYSMMGLGREYRLDIEVCRHTSLQSVPALAATCTENGNRAYFVCSCGKWFEDNKAEREIFFHDGVVIYSQGHQWSEKIENEAHLKSSATDCRSGSQYWYDCAVCDTISDHAYFDDGRVGDHVYSDQWSQGDKTGHWHTCLYCDAHDTVKPHTPGSDATDRAPQLCTVCGYELKPSLKGDTQTEKPGSQVSGNGSGEITPMLGGCVISVADVSVVGLSALFSLLMLKKKKD